MIETVAFADDYGAPASSSWRDTDWTVHERDLLIAGRRVHFVDVGEGSVGFVLVHGMGGRWQHWLETIPFLACHGRVIALDLPGFGQSEPPVRPVSLEAFADSAADLCRAVGLQRTIFLGHSMGGSIALRFAARHPDLAHAIVLVGGTVYTFTALLGLREVARFARQRPKETVAIFTEILTAGLPAPRAVKRLIIERPLLRQVLLSPYFHRPNDMPADTVALVVEGAGTRGVFPTARVIGRSDPCEGLSDVRCPILSIGGRHDRITPAADLQTFDHDAPTATSVVIEGCGHMAMLERPDAFNTRIERFLTEIKPLRPSRLLDPEVGNSARPTTSRR